MYVYTYTHMLVVYVLYSAMLSKYRIYILYIWTIIIIIIIIKNLPLAYISTVGR